MTIKSKVQSKSALSLVLIITIGVVSYRSIDTLVTTADAQARAHTRLEALQDLVEFLKDAESSQRGYILTGHPAYLDPYGADVSGAKQRLVTIRQVFTEPESQANLSALDTGVTAKLAELQEIVELRREKGLEAALKVLRDDDGKKLMDQALGASDRLEERERQQVRARESDAKNNASAARIIIESVTALAFLVVLVFAFIIHRAISRPLEAILAMVEKIGKGDLTRDASTDGKDEFAQLGFSLNQMLAGLRSLAEQTRTATLNLTSAAAEILASTQEQVASTGEQAAAVQQTTVTMDEIRQSGIQIAERARQVSVAAHETASSGTSGLQAVQSTARAMESIREQAEAVAENIVRLSERTQVIGEIIATVNDVAEQSHLLALNAAIEAASAGEHGRSFAVVAAEIKNLADQSKEATTQVRSILGEIQRGINSSVMLTEEAVKRVEAGRQHSETADRTIRQMSDNIQQSVQAFQQIVAGSNQQHIGFEQVVQAIKNIGQASQQTAGSTRQLEKAAANLNALGQQLKSAGDVYRI